MKLENIDIDQTLRSVRKMLDTEEGLSPTMKSSLELLLLIVTLLVNRLGLNSKNSSKPPSADPNRPKTKKASGKRKSGGQEGHIGTTLKKVVDPDITYDLEIKPEDLPKGSYRELEPETRQVIDIDILKLVTEYRAQVLEDQNGKRYIAKFPEGVTRPVQYGVNVKAHVVYLSQSQLIPYNRVSENARDQFGIPISEGSVYNFNEDAYNRLAEFEQILKEKLLHEELLHADETGINVDAKGHWLHCLSSSKWTLFYPHSKRGGEAMNAIGVIPAYSGILCHDHWKPYFKYDCSHALCNAHHQRELERAWEQDNQKWAKEMQDLLLEINQAKKQNGGNVKWNDSTRFRTRYRKILQKGDLECPPPDESDRKGKKGRIPRTKSRNLLERLRDFETETLRFMDDSIVPFTNNQGENDIRMTKVQQKISGCFRSFKGAEIFCRIRSYLSTCSKHNMSATEALSLLFKGLLPDFIKRAE